MNPSEFLQFSDERSKMLLAIRPESGVVELGHVRTDGSWQWFYRLPTKTLRELADWADKKATPDEKIPEHKVKHQRGPDLY